MDIKSETDKLRQLLSMMAKHKIELPEGVMSLTEQDLDRAVRLNEASVQMIKIIKQLCDKPSEALAVLTATIAKIGIAAEYAEDELIRPITSTIHRAYQLEEIEKQVEAQAKKDTP